MAEADAKLDEVAGSEEQPEHTETPDASPEETSAESPTAEAGSTDVASSPTMVLDLEPAAEAPRKDKTRIYQGVCRWFNPKDRYGFIECKDDDVDKDVWVHGSNIQTESGDDGVLVEGQECTFEIITRPPKNPNEAAKYSAQNVVCGPAPKVPRKPKAERHKGVCLWFNDAPDKRFGFIKVTDTDQQIFVHADAIKHGKAGKLVEGQPCDFEIVEQQDGRARAHNVNPGPAPPPDPEANKVHSGKVARWIPERGFGFIRPDKADAEEVMVHRSNLKSSGDNLVEDQPVRYKIRMRRKRRDGGAESPRPEAVEVVPGEVPKRQIYHGVVKFFEPEKGFGFIHRSGRNEDYYVHHSQIVSHNDEETPVLEEGQHCTFVPSVGKNNKLRAIKVIPGAKAEEEKDEAETAQGDETPTGQPDSPLPPDDSLTEEERARREFNYRKKQRRKRAKERQAKDPNYQKPAPVPAQVQVEESQSPRVTRPSKKQKKDKSQSASSKKGGSSPPSEPEPEPESPPARSPKPPKAEKKEREPSDIPKNQKKPKKKAPPPSEQSPEESKVLFRKNKKQNKKSKRGQVTADMKKRRADEAKKVQDAVSEHFDKQAKREQQKQSFATWAYNWVLSWCKWS